MSDQTQQLRDEIVALGRSLFDRGFSVGSAGNLSARIPGGYLMTPTNSSLGRLDPEKLSVLNEAWEHVGGERPSKEVFMHRALYEARPDAQAIVHLHSPYVTAWSCLPEAETEGLPPLTPYFVMRLGRTVPMVPYHRPGDPAMAKGIRAAGELSPGVILANHG
ncbi:class II aldolase/adducin family protein, partial [Leucobacter sp. M11]|uniref:class II aldolase/adducin family protein n=1 Tax=Leucobacter sp. M11 TaxID=2993565 RepID=UPI002D7E3F5C